MADPDAKHCLSPQPTKYSQVRPGMDPHLSSGPPNLAFCTIAKAVGGNSWEQVGQIWYRSMSFVRLYLRVLEQLGSDRRLAWFLALANVALALSQFAEPVLFGRVINLLAGAQASPASADWETLSFLLIAWVAFGLFTIVCGT